MANSTWVIANNVAINCQKHNTPYLALLKAVGTTLDSLKRELRTTVLPDAPAAMCADDIRALRAKLNASQAVFAHYLNVSTQLVQAWEANRRRPEGPALRLLSIGRRDPAVVSRSPDRVTASGSK